MLMKLALEKDFKFQNWVDSVFYLCTPELGHRIYSLVQHFENVTYALYKLSISKIFLETGSWWYVLTWASVLA